MNTGVGDLIRVVRAENGRGSLRDRGMFEGMRAVVTHVRSDGSYQVVEPRGVSDTRKSFFVWPKEAEKVQA